MIILTRFERERARTEILVSNGRTTDSRLLTPLTHIRRISTMEFINGMNGVNHTRAICLTFERGWVGTRLIDFSRDFALLRSQGLP